MGVYIPPGYSPPFQVVDGSHHGAWIIITGALGLVVSLVSLLIRLYVRLVLSPPFAYDDFVLLGATIFAVVQTSLLFGAVSHGFGTAIDLLQHHQVDNIQTALSDILYLITVYVSKCCVVGIHLRLTPQKLHNRVSWATLALCTAWIITSVSIIAINCELNRPWKGAGAQCVNLLKRWQFIVAMDILTEVLLFAVAATLLAGLFMSLKRKLPIGFAFFFRLPLVIFSILHLCALNQTIASQDPTLAAVEPIIWAQVELHYALVACSVFCLRPFMAAVSTNYGTAGDSNLESGSTSRTPKDQSSSSKSGTRGLPSVVDGRERWRVSRSGTWSKTHERLGSDESGAQKAGPMDSSIELVEMDGSDAAECSGGRMFIRKDVQYTIEYDRRS
ncbi:hypothetical protein ANOM_010574 [Aspergillus nomiae NRRL 13137]|uniref:Rhodopsin domain-containing protein n=1 Tax=Aspergillus nomiae NRRL (strain ATCC 15546 / NRRL 13137 / CBS 260.88 / M93) TaxID=1509407 RepID=A0A0L1IR75_ASPN3|nr:uncharacterized protein ANOM_010574 [Aspergillus nomiae NRRL 13137]KNG81982.1 hypothetical protein ANOM_010574 [Aspergillus nomiae NRRL 13137]